MRGKGDNVLVKLFYFIAKSKPSMNYYELYEKDKENMFEKIDKNSVA